MVLSVIVRKTKKGALRKVAREFYTQNLISSTGGGNRKRDYVSLMSDHDSAKSGVTIFADNSAEGKSRGCGLSSICGNKICMASRTNKINLDSKPAASSAAAGVMLYFPSASVCSDYLTGLESLANKCFNQSSGDTTTTTVNAVGSSSTSAIVLALSCLQMIKDNGSNNIYDQLRRLWRTKNTNNNNNNNDDDDNDTHNTFVSIFPDLFSSEIESLVKPMVDNDDDVMNKMLSSSSASGIQGLTKKNNFVMLCYLIASAHWLCNHINSSRCSITQSKNLTPYHPAGNKRLMTQADDEDGKSSSAVRAKIIVATAAESELALMILSAAKGWKSNVEVIFVMSYIFFRLCKHQQYFLILFQLMLEKIKLTEINHLHLLFLNILLIIHHQLLSVVYHQVVCLKEH
jgi:hypothetical protein